MVLRKSINEIFLNVPFNLVVHLDPATHSVFIELALGHLGEDFVHGVPRDVIVPVVLQYPGPVVEEFTVKEDVCDIDLKEDDQQVEYLEAHEEVGVFVVVSPQLPEALDESVEPLLHHLFICCELLHPGGQELHLAALYKRPPKKAGKKEGNSLHLNQR